MSFLDNVITEKPAIVIDIGHAYTKCGFAGENGPHTIIPSKIIQNNVTIKIHDYKAHKKSNSSNFNLKSIDIEEESLKEILNDFLFRIFFKILNSNARERKVVIVESILTDSFFRKVLADVLYKSFQVLSVLFLPSHLATLYALGLNTGLVIDCGFVDCQLLPITESVPMSGLCDFVNLGAQKIHQEIEKLIRQYAFITINNQKTKLSDLTPQLNFTEETIEDIKLRCCFVTNFERSRQIQEEIKSADSNSLANLKFNFASDCDYNLDDKTLHLPGFVRETAFEVLFFDQVDNNQTIQHFILNTLIKCPIDLKKKLSENIILTGGTCMLPGFKNRLQNELFFLLDNDFSYKEKLSIKNSIGFHTPPSLENYTAWLGGAIFGALDILDSYSIQNSKYKDIKAIPDWFTIKI